jgi:hypothetical protein
VLPEQSALSQPGPNLDASSPKKVSASLLQLFPWLGTLPVASFPLIDIVVLHLWLDDSNNDDVLFDLPFRLNPQRRFDQPCLCTREQSNSTSAVQPTLLTEGIIVSVM